jgi:flagellin
MGLRINTNIAALNAHRQLAATDARLTKSIERLSSGYRINHAKDDVAGLSIANKFRTEVRGLRMAQQNVSQGTSMLQVAEGGAMQIEGIVERLKELATSAASSNTDQDGRSRINAEATALLAEIDRIATDTKYNVQPLIDGTGGSFTFQVGSLNTASDVVTLSMADVNVSTASGALDLASISLADPDDASLALASIDAAVGVVNVAMGTIGAAQSRMEFAGANLAVSIENLAASESAVRDADMAYEMIAFTKNQILLQAGTAMLAQANMAPQVVLQLLG